MFNGAGIFSVDEYTARNVKRLKKSSTSPPRPIIGQMYYNTTTNSIELWDGRRWVPVAITAMPKQKHLTGYGTKSGKKYRYPGDSYADK